MSDDFLDFEFDEKPEPKEPAEKPGPFPSKFDSDVLTKDINVFAPCDLHGRLRIIRFNVMATEDYIEGSTFSLCKLPASQVRVLGALSNIRWTHDMGGSLGWAKHKDRHQNIIPGDPYAFNELMDSNGLQTVKVDSLEGVFMVFTADSPGKKGDLIEGYVIYIKM